MRKIGKLISSLAVVVSAAAVSVGIAQAKIGQLIPHRAVYDLVPVGATQQGGLRGRMVYEFKGDACEGYSTNVRFVLENISAQGQRVINDVRSTSFEDPEYTQFQSAMSTYMNNSLSGEMRGSAIREGEEFRIVHTKPENEDQTVAGDARMPTEYMEYILDGAEQGESFVSSRIIDGSPEGVEVMFSTAVIGAFQSGLGDTGSEPEIEKLNGLTGGFWPMTVSYFEPNAENRSEEQPIYAVKFLVYQNGVSRDMTLVYPNFQLRGKLIDLKIFETANCQ